MSTNVNVQVDFWPNFFDQIFTFFGQNYNFLTKFAIFDQISIFRRNFVFLAEFRFLTKFAVFDQISILEHNCDFLVSIVTNVTF